ncbi:MAG: alanine--tRNA ligase, partial [Saprospiraceae bacterium]|nr:alanine--tRNA ligase [Saprospiraceae bacterium]
EILDEVGPTEFLGYDREKSEGAVLAIVKDGKKVEKLEKGEQGIIIANQTPFYAESGGQVGDKGTLKTESAELEVLDTKKQVHSLWLHVVECKKGGVKNKDAIIMEVDHARRGMIRSNHSATHLLHEALRRVLGEHVSQKGSLQDAERTRFDISQPVAMTAQQIEEVEAIVNEEIRANTPVETRVMPLEEARNTGAMALFGEKYADEVRVVAMGTKKEGANKPFSVELCGGTHVKRTGDIGLLKIISESALSSGIRRVEALTGANALRYFEQQDQTLQQVAGTLKASPAEVLERVKNLSEEKRKLEKEVSDLRRQLAMAGPANTSDGAGDVRDIGGIKFTGR